MIFECVGNRIDFRIMKMMKNTLLMKPSMQQLQNFNSKHGEYLRVLSMSKAELLDQIRDIADSNPYISVEGSLSENFWDNQTSKKSLKEELDSQLRLQKDGPEIKAARYIIESLDEHGFYTEDPIEGSKYLHMNFELFLKGLHLVQSFEPYGVAASSSMNAIAIPLHMKNLDQAAWMIENCQDLIIVQNFEGIAKRMDLSIERVHELFEQVRRCNPYPCSEYDTSPAVSRLPEVIVTVEDDHLQIQPAALPEIELFEKQKDTSAELREYFRQAHFFIDSINKRNQTLMIVVNELMSIQESHLMYGIEKNPCTLRDLSERTGLHVSTIARTLKDKYYEMDGKVISFYSLFDSQTRQGTSKSAVVRAMKLLIDQENPEEPYLDEEISVSLEEMELFASRRTIAKYRKEMNIPSSRKRKKQYQNNRY